MQSHFFPCALALAAVLSSPPASLLAATPLPDAQASPRELVQAALAAELDGHCELRKDLLDQALTRDPNFAPARWQSGFVRVRNRWLTVEAAASEERRAGKVSQYRQMRDQVRNTAAGHLQLAQWCSDAGLRDQERFHLMYATQFAPTKTDAQRLRKKLDLVRYQQTLMPAAQAESMKEEAKKSQKLMLEWRPRLSAIQRDLESQNPVRQAAGLEQLRAIARVSSAIPVLDILIARSKRATAKVVIQSVGAMHGQAAADALIRFTLLAKHEESRRAAAEELKSRSMFSYVPTLMGALEPLVKVQFTFGYTNSTFWHQLALYQEGPMIDRAFNSSGGSSIDTLHVYAMRETIVFERMTTNRPDQTADADFVLAGNELTANTMRQEINERIAMALRIATENDLDAESRVWWSWWLDYNEMYQPPIKPLDYVSADTTPEPFTFRVISISCFPAGTPVQTLTGPMAIEQVRPGECVLAQDPDTGELAYKPVLATTIRPFSPLVSVRLALETIRATRGHPFWVSGVGWQMAKELKAGQWLHTTAGPVQIESTDQQDKAECYNLVVADFNSFFVGDSQVLVHDNNLRQVTTAMVPGLIAP